MEKQNRTHEKTTRQDGSCQVLKPQYHEDVRNAKEVILMKNLQGVLERLLDFCNETLFDFVISLLQVLVYMALLQILSKIDAFIG